MNTELMNKIIDKIKELRNPEFRTLPLFNNKELYAVKSCLLNMEIEETSKIKELEAKIFVYEEIIKKSNFAPMLKENKKKLGDSSNE